LRKSRILLPLVEIAFSSVWEAFGVVPIARDSHCAEIVPRLNHGFSGPDGVAET